MPRPVVSGINDLQSQFPEIAAEAYGWDPSTVARATSKKLQWKCPKGHIYAAKVSSRTGSIASGCSICAGKQVLPGFNDLKTKFPDVAAEAFGWDPARVTAVNGQKLIWKCKKGHIFSATVASRTTGGCGCPVCSGRQVLAGFNDLKTKFPDVAAEAFGWDPTKVAQHSGKNGQWKCSLGHIFSTTVASRTTGGRGCPVCSSRQILPGFNDLQSHFPEIAAEAYGWDPSTVTKATNKKLKWKCSLDHQYSSTVNGRTLRSIGCPYCAGKQVLPGFNDLKTKFPDVAAEAFGWDPATITSGAGKKLKWKCSFGHIYSATVGSRTNIGSGCPVCAEYGFNPEKDAWFYLMQRPGEQQLGITNELDVRLKAHRRNGWDLLDHTEPASGQKVLDTENAFKKWLKKEIGLIKGTTENWSTTSMEVQSLAELKARSGIETDLF